MFYVDVVTIEQHTDGWRTLVPLFRLSHQKYQSSTNHIAYLLLPVPQFRVVDAHSPNFPRVLVNNTISTLEMQRTTDPLPQMNQFMQKSLNVSFLIHIRLKFNQKVTRAISPTHNITITNNLLTFQSLMSNINRDFVTWKEVIQKPRGNILTEDLRITVSRMVDVRHVPQCRNQINDETNRSFSLEVTICG